VEFQERLQTTLGAAYRLERELGGGGMSRTFVAAETSLGRRVVVKVLPPDLAAGVSSERFRKEIHLAASLQHPHIVSVLAAGQGDDLLYYTMPLIEGTTLRARLQQSGELPIVDAVHILRDVARALAYAHRHGVVHRDIKPENILLSEDGAMVADFGVAKALSASTTGDSTGGGITGHGVALGTPAYMSPEQAAADPQTDQRTDIYSLGVVAYEMLAGFSPFGGRPTTAMLAAHALEVPAPVETRRAGLPTPLAALVSRCLQKRPADRPQTAEAVLHELTAVEQGLSAPRVAERPAWRRSRATQTAALAMVLVFGAATAYYRSHSAPSTADAATHRRTIAVLPFANIGEAKADESFSDGITEELIGALGKIEQLRVKSASSLKGSPQDPRDLGKQLDVESVVAGSMRRSGDMVRVSARLVNVADGFQIWSDTYERELRSTKDVFGIEDEITKAIVNALQLKLSLSGEGEATRQTANLDAYDAVKKGRYFMAKRNPEDIRTAIGFFEAAVRKDSNYALAWDGLADANALLNTYAFVQPDEVFSRARAAVSKALSLDSNLAAGYATSGYIGLNNTWDWSAVDHAFKRSIDLDPNYATAHHWFSLYLDAMGRGPEALKEIQRALDLDPLSLIIHREEGRTYYYTGDNEHALQQYRRTLELDPTFRSVHVWIARAYIAQGKYSNAVDELRDQPDFQGGHSSAVLAYAYAKAGQRDRAQAILEELEARAKRENVWPMYIALTQMALGNREAALKLIESEYDRRSAQMAYIGVDPLFSEFRGEPRFRRILDKMKLPAR
jgi:serine/threonine-protein kinase